MLFGILLGAGLVIIAIIVTPICFCCAPCKRPKKMDESEGEEAKDKEIHQSGVSRQQSVPPENEGE